MTPLEEAVARIIDPGAWRLESLESDFGAKEHERRRYRRTTASNRARRILALPEIVKMQEALEFYADRNTWVGGSKVDMESPNFDGWSPARAALQPLKKEAE